MEAPPVPDPTPASALHAARQRPCHQCGRCCRDLIIDQVFEVDLLREPKLRDCVTAFGDESGEYFIETPCKLLKGNKCSIYPTRPGICVAFVVGSNPVCPHYRLNARIP